MTEGQKKSFFETFFSEKTGVVLSIIFFVILCTATIVFLFFGSWTFSQSLDESKVGQFGDFVGGVAGTLVAFIGIILYYVALKEQRKDSQLNQAAFNLQIKTFEQQVEEFTAQRDELITTRKIYEQQTKTMRTQQFDSNFYSLLTVYTALKKNLNKEPNVDFFEDFYKTIFTLVRPEEKDSIIDIHNKVIIEYVENYLNVTSQLAPYFKTIYRLLKLIDDCDHLTDTEKLFYSKVIRGQLTDYEVLILYYNYHSYYGSAVQGIALKYQLLKHIQTLSKIEFSKKFELNDKKGAIRFVEWFTYLIKSNYEYSKSLESESIKIQERYEPYCIVIELNFDLNIEINLIIKKEELKHLPLDRDTFRVFIFSILYDAFSLSSFEQKTENSFKDSIIEREDKIIFNYILEL